MAGYKVADGLNLAAAEPAPVVPPAPAFAGLGDMTVSDNLGMPIVPTTPAGGVTDHKGRTMVYSATRLPATTGGGADTPLATNTFTGMISGTCNSDAGGGLLELITVTVNASATGSTKLVSKTVVLSIQNDA